MIELMNYQNSSILVVSVYDIESAVASDHALLIHRRKLRNLLLSGWRVSPLWCPHKYLLFETFPWTFLKPRIRKKFVSFSFFFALEIFWTRKFVKWLIPELRNNILKTNLKLTTIFNLSHSFFDFDAIINKFRVNL